ncbi:MAG: hypothetical protein ACOCV1_06545 [Bacillota bacterium]
MIKYKNQFKEECRNKGLSEDEINSIFEEVENVNYFKLQMLKEKLIERYNEDKINIIFQTVYRSITDNDTLQGVISKVDWIQKKALERYIENNDIDFKTICKNNIFISNELIEVAKNTSHSSIVAGYFLARKINGNLNFVEDIIKDNAETNIKESA